jgi:thiaminase/transcriptional activator TenA
MYADPAFAELAEWCRALVDRLADEAGPAARERMASAFVTSSRYELAFWQMAWSLERWPDQAADGPPAPSSEGSPDPSGP